jgi:dienelactone hydrolase
MPLNQADDLRDFTKREITLEGVSRTVWQRGTGPAVLIFPEMPGISPHVARFARWVSQAGCTVYLPSLFGLDGAVADLERGEQVFAKLCVSAEFRLFAGGQSSPVTTWLRALANLAHAECGGPGVGVVGMCLTGNFALTMMVESSVLAAVVSQPSLPLDAPAALESSPAELAAVRARLEAEDLQVRAYRFAGDQICRAERFAAYSQALGERFVARELPDSAANLDGAPGFFAKHVNYPHSVLTVHLVNEEGSLTTQMRDEVLGYLTQQLGVAPSLD